MTQRQRWPNYAEDARLESIAAARTSLRVARELARRENVSAETLKGLAAIADALHTIIESLIEVGPKSAPMLGA